MLALMMWIPVGTGRGGATLDCSAVAEIRTKTKLPSTVGRKWASVGWQMTVLGRNRKRREGDKGTKGTKKKGRRKLLATLYLTGHAVVLSCTHAECGVLYEFLSLMLECRGSWRYRWQRNGRSSPWTCITKKTWLPGFEYSHSFLNFL